MYVYKKYICIFVCTYTCMNTYICTYICTCIQAYRHTDRQRRTDRRTDGPTDRPTETETETETDTETQRHRHTETPRARGRAGPPHSVSGQPAKGKPLSKAPGTQSVVDTACDDPEDEIDTVPCDAWTSRDAAHTAADDSMQLSPTTELARREILS